MIRKIIATSLASVFSISMLASCSQQGEMEKPFVKEKYKYSYVAENLALTLYVDANSNAEGDGSESAPFKTIQEAQTKIREIKAGDGLPVGGITVLVKDGEYKLDSSLIFNEEDSGTEECPITYVSETEFGAVLTGGIVISGADFEAANDTEKNRILNKTASDNLVKVDLKKYGLSEKHWGKIYSYGSSHHGGKYEGGTGDPLSEVFLNDKRLTLARYPNNDFAKIVSVIDNGDSYYFRNGDDLDGINPDFDSIVNPRGGTYVVDDDMAEHMEKWENIDEVWNYGYLHFDWSDASNPLKEYDSETKAVTLSHCTTYGITRDRRYYFFNVFEELDTENEYYIDRENGILYLNRSEDFENATVKLSTVTENLITMNNVEYITVKGFSVSETRALGLAATGNNIVIENCEFKNIQSGAINLSGENLTVQNCKIYSIGSYGIYVNGGNLETLERSNNLIYNNEIHHWAEIRRTYQAAINLQGCGNTASHNEIYYSPHEAITWYGPYQTIEYNHIHEVCLETQDAAAIYAGRNHLSYGTVIKYNLIENVGSDTADACGIYFDDGLSGQTAYGNILVNVTGRAFLLGGGRDLDVRNNVVINAGNFNIDYDDRDRAEWFPENLPGFLSEVPIFTNEYWSKAFPELSKCYFSVNEPNKEPAEYLCNPANSIVKNNVHYKVNDACVDFDISSFVKVYSDVSNNPVLRKSLSDMPNYLNEDYTMIENSRIRELIPEFEIIPFSEIGRVE